MVDPTNGGREKNARWPRRTLWLAAWGVWVWLSYGLYRQLPRDLGPAVAQVPLEKSDRILGFVGGKPTLAIVPTWTGNATDEAWLFDVKTKTMTPRSGGRILGSAGLRWSPLTSSYVAPGATSPPPLARDGTGAIQLPSGTAHYFPVRTEFATFHRTKPWALLTLLGFFDGSEPNAVAFDLVTGKRLFDWRKAPSNDWSNFLSAPAFFLDGDRIATPTMKKVGVVGDVGILEIRSLSELDKQPRCIRNLVVGHDVAVGLNDRIAWIDANGGSLGVQVFDLAAEKMLFSQPPDQTITQLRLLQGGRLAPFFSADGKNVFAPMSGTLFEIATGRALWTAGEEDNLLGEWNGVWFEIFEDWSVEIGKWKSQTATYAVRSMTDGSLVHRTWAPTLKDHAEDENGVHFHLVNDIVHELPPRVNVTLVAICQAILAVPLVVVWFARWLRKRRPARLS